MKRRQIQQTIVDMINNEEVLVEAIQNGVARELYSAELAARLIAKLPEVEEDLTNEYLEAES